jgi:hypothetical protein
MKVSDGYVFSEAINKQAKVLKCRIHDLLYNDSNLEQRL